MLFHCCARRLVPGLFAMALGLAASTHAATVTLIPSADASMMEIVPDNSMGAAEWIISGTTQNGPRMRALMKFDVAGELPAGAKIMGVSFTVGVIRQSGEAPAGASFGFHRMLRSWGEGVNIPETQPGLGVPAATGDATWNGRFFPLAPWGEPGGAADVDYVSQPSSSVIVDTIGIFSVEGTFELISDIQLWLDEPALNHGWMLKSQSEETRFTARQFASREYSSPDVAPRLTIDYTPAPRLSVAFAGSNAVTISFAAEASGSYSLESKPAFDGANGWAVLTNFGTVTAGSNLLVTLNATNAQRFYRVRMD